MKAILRAVRKTVVVKLARYRVEAYDGMESWGSHACLTKADALDWMRMYPVGAQVVVFSAHDWRVVAERHAVEGWN
jgi:hypothetical protein